MKAVQRGNIYSLFFIHYSLPAARPAPRNYAASPSPVISARSIRRNGPRRSATGRRFPERRNASETQSGRKTTRPASSAKHRSASACRPVLRPNRHFTAAYLETMMTADMPAPMSARRMRIKSPTNLSPSRRFFLILVKT